MRALSAPMGRGAEEAATRSPPRAHGERAQGLDEVARRDRLLDERAHAHALEAELADLERLSHRLPCIRVEHSVELSFLTSTPDKTRVSDIRSLSDHRYRDAS